MKWPRAAYWIVPSLLVLAAFPAPAEVVERVVVKVNGEILTMSEFAARQVAAVQAAQVPPQGVEAYLRRNNARILEEAVEDLLLVQRAAEIGIALQPAYIDSIIGEIKRENGIENDDQFARQLRQEGMTLADLRRSIEHSVLRREVLQAELSARTEVGDAEVIAAYERRKAAEFTEPASVTLQEIVVTDRDLARELAARAGEGADFSELARAHSVGPTAAAGGDLGTLAPSDLSPTIAKVLDELEPGEISPPLPSGDEYRLLRLVLRTEARVKPFEEVKAVLRRQLQNRRREEAYKKYVADLRSKAVIQQMVREVALDVDASGIQLAPDALDRDDATSAPEFEGLETAPGSGPERVVPPSLPGDAAPTPTPTPTPEPE